MNKEIELSAMSFAIDSEDDSRLFTNSEFSGSSALIDSSRIIPLTTATYSLFSENSLFLIKD